MLMAPGLLVATVQGVRAKRVACGGPEAMTVFSGNPYLYEVGKEGHLTKRLIPAIKSSTCDPEQLMHN